MERETGMNRLAEEKGFAVVYPIAKPRDQQYLGKVYDWNSPGAGLTSPVSGYDDADYIKGILDNLKKDAKIDERAIYAVGFSSGGAFSQHLRGRLPGVFAGVGSVHGTLLGTEAKPKPGDSTAFISVHSDSDHMLPVDGGRGLMTIPLPRVADSQPLMQKEVAREANQLDASPKVTVVGDVEITEYPRKNSSEAPVKEYLVRGGWRGGALAGILGRGRDGFPANHAWDGLGEGGWPIVGEKNRHLDTSRLIVEELLKYRKPDGAMKFSRDLHR